MLNRLVLKWRAGVPDQIKEDVIDEFSLVLERDSPIGDLYSTSLKVLQTSKLIFETGLVVYCVPEFIARFEKQYFPNDEYFDKQFYLHNTGQVINDGNSGTPDADIDAPEAWDITMGDPSIIVAVIDEGVTANHPDLPNSRQLRLPGSNFAYLANPTEDPDDPEPLGFQEHGNMVAGIVAATMDNNEGVAGIAPYCTIMPVKFALAGGGTSPNSVSDFANAMTFAVDNGANIIVGSVSNGASNPNSFPSVITAAEYAADNNVLIVFAAGNTAMSNPPRGYVTFPANINQIVPEVIAVGASDRNDERAGYSPFLDVKVEIAAPSHRQYNCYDSNEAFEVWTIDNPGNDGNNPYTFATGVTCFYNVGPVYNEIQPASGTNHLSYQSRGGGTSAAAPQVAGVAALILSVNSCLAPIQTKEILLKTTDKVGGYDYNWNFLLPGHSKEMGFGRLNAHQAVLEAQCPNLSIIQEPQIILCEGETGQMDINIGDENCYNYNWSPTAGLSDPSVLNPSLNFTNIDIAGYNALYTLTATSVDNPSCSVQAQVSVQIPCVDDDCGSCAACNSALLEVDALDDQICNQSSTQFFVNVASGDQFTYEWSPPWQLDDPTSPAPVYTPIIGSFNVNGSYAKSFTVVATSVENPECKLIKTVSVEVLCGNGCAICGSTPTPNNPNCQARMQIKPNPVRDHFTVKVNMGRRYLPPVIWSACPIPPFNGDIKIVHLATRNLQYEDNLVINDYGRGALSLDNTANWPQGLYLVSFEYDGAVLASRRIIKL